MRVFVTGGGRGFIGGHVVRTLEEAGHEAACEKAGVCLVISGPGRATLSMCYPTDSCSPTQLAGITEDGVTGVRVVLNGRTEKAVFANDAWYYGFPNNHTPDTAATELLVSLSNGRTVAVPIPVERLGG